MPEIMDKKAVVETLNRILEAELACAVRYTHYSLMVFGYSRIPIVSWLREQCNECLTHAHEVGELITHLGEHPSLAMGELLETHQHDIGQILTESLEMEQRGLKLYYRLLELVSGKSVTLEEFSRKMIMAEELHIGEVDKMLRKPGEIASVVENPAEA